MTVIERLRDKANSLPEGPGVYIMKDTDGAVLYVGKSKKLKNRVSSYFVGTHKSTKTAKLVSLVRDFDYIVCKSEIEALTLENVLIKKHSPKYNIKLKDAKSYPYIKVSQGEYPRLFVTRERKSDGGRYFGPYSGSSAAHAALGAVMKVFMLPSCKHSFPKDIGRVRPCIYRDIGRCVAPCAGSVTAEEYRELVKGAERVLSGSSDAAKRSLEREMERAAGALEFERAATLRDSIMALDKLSEKQKVVADASASRDVFSFFASEVVGALAMLSIRAGALINKNEFIVSALDEPSSEELISLIASHYEGTDNFPKEIMLGFSAEKEDLELLSDYVSLLAGRRVYARTPERGEGRALCDMALDNARESAKQKTLEGEREDKNIRRISELLGLGEIPERIEAYDISNIGNENIVGSMVVWQDGRLKKSDYRLFSVKSTKGADDYGSMREVISRRVAHIGDATASLGDTPGLILVDGGRGHVAVAREVLESASLDIPVFGMVKDDYHKTRALCDLEHEISIAKEFDVYGFVYNLQEEAHRFAVKSSSKAKTKTLTHSILEKIEGIGPAKARALLKSMPLGKIKSATAEELLTVKGIGRSDAERVVDYFKKSKRGKKENDAHNYRLGKG
ncbi:MAG: excinuclease ABC subunit UvrC [Clostridia bacterium]|nr:excinuclease ABC subunit UvrC [Clostridia bacterium]